MSANHDAPFSVKKKVFEAAFSSAILYGCETWLKVPLKPVETLYMTGVKTMLGVRTTTPNLMCLLEAGLPSVQAMIREKQAKFLRRMGTRQGMPDDPLWFALEMTKQENRVMNSHMEQVMNVLDHISTDKEELMERVRSNEGSKYRTYLSDM